ncbi:hypothetical protein MTO96_042326, partial [Rhipicephalus appendiculatus]
ELEDSKPTRFFRDWRTALELYARRLVRDQQHLLFLSVEANVSYSPAANAIIVPEASLHPGIFYQDGPDSVNYGGLGTAQRLFHAQLTSDPPDSENLADFVGLLAAHSAFTALPYEERTLSLHGVPLNADQTFYAFHCAKLCETNGKGSSHSRQDAARLRCVMPLMNSEAFADAFRCPYSSPMNPPKKCSLL